MGALDAVDWEDCVLQPQRNPQAERFLRKELGIVPPGTRYFLESAWMTRAFPTLSIERVPLLYASSDLSQMIALVVSQDNSCRYCYAATRSFMRILGFAEERIRRLEENTFAGELSPADTGALEFARTVSRAAPLAGAAECRPLLELGFSPAAVREIAFFSAANIFFNRISTLPALPPEEMELDRRWYVRLMRPFLARLMQSARTTEPVALSAAQRQGPFAPIVNGLDGLPGAPRLRAVLDDAWQSTALPRRTKALVFAVIARGLGCALSEQEARRLLIAEGDSPGLIDQTLAHLTGPDLAPIDAAAAALARESIWVRPAHIQRQVRSIRSLFTQEQFIELLGLASLANMVCRLGVASAIVDAPH